MRHELIPVSIVYPFDPLGLPVGGIQTFLRGFIAKSPQDFDIRHLGVTTDAVARPVGVPTMISLLGRSLKFLPVLHDRQENTHSKIPLSLRYTFAARKWTDWCADSVALFNRIEPAVLFRNHAQPKIAVVHTDVSSMLGENSEVTWKHAPGIYSRLEKRLINDFDHVYTVSTRTLSLYTTKYPNLNGRVSFLPTWVDESVFAPATSPRPALRTSARLQGLAPPDVPWLLFVGRFQEAKDPILLVNAFAAMRAKGSTAVLLMIGDGNLRKDIESHAEQLGVRNAITFVNPVDQVDLAHFYQSADLFLMTSRFEGMPRAALEAVGCGLPVVTTRVGEVARFVIPGVTGEIVDSRNPRVFADAALKALAERHKYTANACVKAVSDFRPASILNDVYRRVRTLAKQCTRPRA